MDKRIMDINEQINAKRSTLSEDRWSDYCEGLSGWDRGVTAQLLENQATYLASLNEETRTSSIGSFEKFVFPMIRTVWPNLVTQELVSVQPMEGPISMIFFLDFTAGTAKGQTTKGSTLISSRTGMNEASYLYPSETVKDETLAATTGVGPYVSTTNLAHIPVRPGSVSATYTLSSGTVTRTVVDDGNGSLFGTNVTGTINYTTGALVLTITGTDADAGSLFCSYEYNSEMSDSIPQIDASLTSGPIVSRADKLRVRWSVEVAAQLKSVHGLDAEVELTEALAQQIRFGIDNKIINDLFAVASAGSVTFDANPPSGSNIPFFTHQMSLVKVLQSGSNKVFKATRRGFANWIIAGVDAATIMEAHPLFESAGNLNGPGVVFSGVLANRWQVFKNPFLTDSSKFLMGYKGQNFFDAGYVYAPWIPMYMTPTITLDDMMMRKAFLTHYGRKVVNSLFYCTGQIINA